MLLVAQELNGVWASSTLAPARDICSCTAVLNEVLVKLQLHDREGHVIQLVEHSKEGY